MDDIELRGTGRELRNAANDIAKHRMLSAKNRVSFQMILASKESELRQRKANAGIDTMILMLLGEGDERTNDYYRKWQYHENKYKGLEHIENSIKEDIHIEKFLGKV